MCGIFGFYGFEDEGLLDEMEECLIHRGPDQSGQYSGEKIGLGNTRLSIIGLGNGKQPIHNEDETVQVVYNGEIYNHESLRKDLEDKGHDFYTDADTEVIVHLYEEHGEDLVEHLRGMFAFALYDTEEEKLLLARDRMGQKPLHYAETDDGIVFASEIKALLKHPGIEAQVDTTALDCYMTYQYVPSPYTLFDGICSLPPATVMTVDDETREKQQYWDISFTDAITSEHEAVTRLQDTLEESVAMRMMSEVPISAYLSGGLDSSTIVGIMAQHTDIPVKTYSVGFNEPNDETAYARQVAEYHDTDHTEVMVDETSTQLLPEIIYSLDQPIADAGIIPSYILASHVATDAKVVLSGNGSDELWGGYPKFRTMPKADRYRRWTPKTARKPLKAIESLLPYMGRPNRLLRYLGSDTAAAMYREYTSVFADEERSQLLQETTDTPQTIMENAFRKEKTVFNQMSRFDLTYLLPDDFLMKSDKTAMAHSVEARAPFTDHRLVELGAQIHSNLKVNGRNEKYVLKKAAKPFVPDAIIKRKKKGFNVPYSTWLERSADQLKVDQKLEELEQLPYFNTRKLKRVREQRIRGKKNIGLKKWTLLNFKLWHERYIG